VVTNVLDREESGRGSSCNKQEIAADQQCDLVSQFHPHVPQMDGGKKLSDAARRGSCRLHVIAHINSSRDFGCQAKSLSPILTYRMIC